MNRDHLNYSNIKTDQNTEKCSGDHRRLAITQTLVDAGVKNSKEVY